RDSRPTVEIRHVVRTSIAVIATVVVCAGAGGGSPVPVSNVTWGSVRTYVVQPGDSLARLASREAVDRAVLAARNGIDPGAEVHAGRSLLIDNRHIVPPAAGGVSIVVNLPQRMVFVFGQDEVSAY